MSNYKTFEKDIEHIKLIFYSIELRSRRLAYLLKLKKYLERVSLTKENVDREYLKFLFFKEEGASELNINPNELIDIEQRFLTFK